MTNPIKMAKELLIISEDLPFRFDYSTGEKVSLNDFEIHTFEQNWGSTALGFDGIGGQAITSARTYVFEPICVNQKFFVYFGCKFAYAVPYSSILMKDIAKQNMVSVNKRGKYLVKE